MKNYSRLIIERLTISAVDLISIIFPFFISIYFIKSFFGNLSAFLPTNEYDGKTSTHIALALICVGWFWVKLRHYTYRKPFWFELKEILRTLIIFAVIELAITAFSKWQFSRYLWGFTWILVFIFVPLFRSIARLILNKLGLWGRRAIIIGAGKNAFDAYSAINSERNLGFDVDFFISSNDYSIGKINDIAVKNYNCDILNKIDDKTIQFIIALESHEVDLRDEWLKALSKKGFGYVSVIPTIRGLPLYGTDMAFIFSHEVMIFRVNNNLAKMTSRFLKRLFDICVSIVIFVLCLPVFLYLSREVRKDGGPAIYGHERIGRGGRKFKCLKFRSMVPDSQKVLEELLANNDDAKREWNKDFKLKNDPRITKIGRFIRKTSLDELPQLFNVLKGDMSLVGPRPIVQAELERYEDDVDYYLMAKPGMTGLWQVSGRNDVDYTTRVYFDSWYVKNWSLWNDVAILFKTVKVVFNRNGAY